jgi:hypothetical protein
MTLGNTHKLGLLPFDLSIANLSQLRRIEKMID